MNSQQATTGVFVYGSPNPAKSGQTVTLTATVWGPNAEHVEGGTVTFTDSTTGKVLGTAPVHDGRATITVTFS